ncbi:MAG: hypothetical protein ACOC36_01455 [Fibrobacterota bacterium]
MTNRSRKDTSEIREKRLRARRVRRRFFLVLICIILCGIVVYNNRDWIPVEGSSNQKLSAESEQGARKASSVTNRTVPSENDSAALKSAEVVQQISQPGSLVLSEIKCKIAGRNDLEVILTVEIFFNNDALYQEVLFKRDDLKVMVMDVMRHKEFGAVKTETLRTEILDALNEVLEAGELERIDIRDFRVE